MKQKLVIVDLVNGFLVDGPLADPGIRKNIIKEVEIAVQQFIKNGQEVIAVSDNHLETDEEFKQYPVHCLKGSWESELVPELKKYQDAGLIRVIEKRTTDAYNEQEYIEWLDNNRDADRMVFTGCLSEVCVYNLVNSTLGHIIANDYNIEVVVPENMVDTFNAEGHERGEVNKKALAEMYEMGATIITKKQKATLQNADDFIEEFGKTL